MTQNDTFQIRGKVEKVDLEGGFWGITDEDGNQWQPVNMPEQLKRNGATVECTARKVDVATSAMWGEAVWIISFETP